MVLAVLVVAQPVGGVGGGVRASLGAEGLRVERRAGACADDQLELIDIDTLFYVANRGLSRIFVELNGHAFKLVTDTAEWRHSSNAFPIPRFGEITVGIGGYIRPGDNCMRVRSQGPSGSEADLVVGDLLVPGQHVAYAIRGLVPLPERFAVVRAAPNPFRGVTTLAYEIPATHLTGLAVDIAVYDAAGRRVRTLVAAWQYPGRFTVPWDGRGEAGQLLASGVYFCRVAAGPYRATISVVRTE